MGIAVGVKVSEGVNVAVMVGVEVGVKVRVGVNVIVGVGVMVGGRRNAGKTFCLQADSITTKIKNNNPGLRIS
jgi:protein involved in ribonucleotide reduction